MPEHIDLSCACGKLQLQLEGAPILCAECHCTSCRTAGEQLQALNLARPMLEPNGGTRFVLYRKDRIHFRAGTDALREHRLSARSKTRRLVATCCNSPVCLEFQGGHWLSLYSSLWPESIRPAIEMRTMISDLPDASKLPHDVPNAKRQSLAFFRKLLGAWVAMGFRAPRLELGRQALHAQP